MANRLRIAIGTLALLSLALFGAGCDLNGSSTNNDPTPGGGGIYLDGGNAYSGGGAGGLNVSSYASVTFKNSGSADASFAVPAYAWTTNLGTNGVTVAANSTVALVYYGGGGTMPAPGTLYMLVQDDPIVANRPNLYKANIDNVLGQAADVVTGLKVNEGVTLTLPANQANGGSALQIAQLQFESDVEINGTLKTAGLNNTEVDSQGHLLHLPQIQRHGSNALAIDKACLAINANRLKIGGNGSINTAGGNAAAAESRGGDSGRVNIRASTGFINRGTILASGGNGNGAEGGNSCVRNNDPTDQVEGVYLFNTGALVNAGAITANGGNGTTGGQAGYIYLDANQSAFNTATLAANGGTGLAGNGGNASYVSMFSSRASVMNSGNINAAGGNGTTGGGNGTTGGGTGAYLQFVSGNDDYIGNTVNSGAITLSGGNVTGTSGNGGNAGSSEYGAIYFYARGRVANSGTLVAAGGTGKGTGNGGSGGDLNLLIGYAQPYKNPSKNNYNAPGPIQLSGDITLAGGAAAATATASGGNGGSIDVTADDDYSGYTYPIALPVEFLGYGDGFTANGGSGYSSGGSAGTFELYTYTVWAFDDNFQPPTPSIFNNVKLTLRGGNASGAGVQAGSGGWVKMKTTDEGSGVVGTGPFELTNVTNAGDIDARGGEASGANGTGGDGGGLYFYAYNKVTNSGFVNSSGGTASGTGGTGGGTGGTQKGPSRYDGVEMYATYDVENSGNILNNGGNATGINGNGGRYAGDVSMSAGGTVRCTGAVSANGGNGTGSGTNGTGGYINLFSQSNGTVYGSLSAAKGTGGTAAGSNGRILVDDNLLFGDDIPS